MAFFEICLKVRGKDVRPPSFADDADTERLVQVLQIVGPDPKMKCFAGLKGKLVGISVREAEYQGVVYTEIGRLESVKQVRAGTVRPMKPRASGASAAPASSSFTPVEDGDIPF